MGTFRLPPGFHGIRIRPYHLGLIRWLSMPKSADRWRVGHAEFDRCEGTLARCGGDRARGLGLSEEAGDVEAIEGGLDVLQVEQEIENPKIVLVRGVFWVK